MEAETSVKNVRGIVGARAIDPASRRAAHRFADENRVAQCSHRLAPCTMPREEAHMSDQSDETTLPETPNPAAGHPGSERERDEQRGDAGPQYGGRPWSEADRRGDNRFGTARNDDADPSELAPGEAENDDDEAPDAADPELAEAEEAGEIESGGQRAGMGRGEKPRKSKSEEP
jgi:hypothetical protein